MVRVMVESLSERIPLEGKTKGVQWRDQEDVVMVGGAQSCRAEMGPSCDIAVGECGGRICGARAQGDGLRVKRCGGRADMEDVRSSRRVEECVSRSM